MVEMSEDEIKQFARNAILRACNIPFGNFDERIPIVESEEGEIGFKLNFNTKLARMEVIYSPQPYLEVLIKGILQTTSDDSNLMRGLGAVEDTAVLIIKMMSTELETASNLIPYIAGELWLKLFNQMKFLSSESFFLKSRIQQRNIIEELLKFSRDKQVTRIINLIHEISEMVSAPQYLFCDVYEQQFKIWKEAEGCYKANKKYGNPLGAVKINFNFLPDDLIRQLENPDKETARPSTIALEHAARILNVKTSDRLSRYLTNSRKMRQNISDQGAQAAADKFFDFTENITSIIADIDKEKAANDDFENGSK